MPTNTIQDLIKALCDKPLDKEVVVSMDCGEYIYPIKKITEVAGQVRIEVVN